MGLSNYLHPPTYLKGLMVSTRWYLGLLKGSWGVLVYLKLPDWPSVGYAHYITTRAMSPVVVAKSHEPPSTT